MRTSEIKLHDLCQSDQMLSTFEFSICARKTETDGILLIKTKNKAERNKNKWI